MELDTLVAEGHQEISRTTVEHGTRWGLGTSQRWILDQTDGRVVWSFEDHVASAPAQILGSWSREAGSFVWAWDNDSISDPLCATASLVRSYGMEHDIRGLTTSPLPLDEQRARDLVALAFRVGRCTGLFHPSDGRLATYIAFGEVTLEEAGGRTTTFQVSAP